MNNLNQNRTLAPELRLSLKEELKAIEKGKTLSAWYNPCTSRQKDPHTGQTLEPETIYVGESANMTPTWETPALHVPSYTEGMSLFRTGKIGKDDSKVHNPYYPEFQEMIKEATFREQEETSKFRYATTITSDDFPVINVLNVMAELLGTQYRNFVLQDALTPVNTPSIILHIDSYNRFAVSQDVPEGVTPMTKKGAFSRQEITIGKDVGHIALSDEAQLRPLQHDIYQTHVENAVADLKRVKAKKTATLLQTATGVAGADFALYTSDHSTTNPYDLIGTVQDTIISNDGIPNVIASADRPYRDFISNTNVKGFASGPPTVDSPGAKVVNSPGGLTGYTWYVDNEMPNTLLVVMDRRAGIYIQGPVRSAQYRLEVPGTDGYIIRDWNKPVLVQTARIRQLTGVSA